MRSNENDTPKVERACGAPSETELEQIRQAYRDGCQGEILIGLRGDERVLTMLLPAQSDAEATETLKKSTEKLKEIGCDRAIRIGRTKKKVGDD